MTTTHKQASQPDHTSLIKRILTGAVIGLLVISYFLLALRKDHPYWGRYWIIRPLIVLPFAGAMGGLCNYLLVSFYKRIGISKTMAVIVSVIIFIIGLWLGIVLGLNGTMWN